MRKKQPVKQKYARHVCGQFGSSIELSEGRGDMSGIETVSVGALEMGSVPSLPFRLSLSNDRTILATICEALEVRRVGFNEETANTELRRQ